MDKRPIGVFDSGIGGLTVLNMLKETIENEQYIYLGDTENFPYGEKTREEIVELSRKNIRKLLDQNVKMVVIACGTATSQALEIMQKEFEIPIIGIIEPTVDYVSTLNLEKIGVIATTGTIRSGVWEKKLKEKMPKLNIVNRACPLLAGIAEEGKATSKESLDAVHEYMEIFKENEVNTIILGCTHYPIYDTIIRNEFEYEVNLINTADPVSVEVRKKLKEYNIENC